MGNSSAYHSIQSDAATHKAMATMTPEEQQVIYYQNAQPPMPTTQHQMNYQYTQPATTAPMPVTMQNQWPQQHMGMQVEEGLPKTYQGNFSHPWLGSMDIKVVRETATSGIWYTYGQTQHITVVQAGDKLIFADGQIVLIGSIGPEGVIEGEVHRSGDDVRGKFILTPEEGETTCGWKLGLAIALAFIVSLLALWGVAVEMGWTDEAVSWTTSQVNSTIAWVQHEVKPATGLVQHEVEDWRVWLNSGTEEADGQEHELPEPSWAAYALSWLVVLPACCCGGCGACGIIKILLDLIDRGRMPPILGWHFEEAAHPSILEFTLLGELAFGLLQPLVVCSLALLMAWLSGSGNVPLWAQVPLLSLPIIRSLIADLSLMHGRRGFRASRRAKARGGGDELFVVPVDDVDDVDRKLPPTQQATVWFHEHKALGANDNDPTWFQLLKSVCFSTAEALDGGTDGFSVAIVWLLERDAGFRQRLLAGWAHGPASLLLPAIEHLGLAGVMALVLAVASAAQALSGALLADARGQGELCEMVGLGGMAVLLPKSSAKGHSFQLRLPHHLETLARGGAPALPPGQQHHGAGGGLGRQPELGALPGLERSLGYCEGRGVDHCGGQAMRGWQTQCTRS